MELREAIRRRRMVRSFDTRPVDDEVLDRVLDAWSAPYWWIDGGAAVQNMLLAAFGEGLGALLFGLFFHQEEILRAFGVPDGHEALGAIALGHPLPEEPVRSSPLPRRTLADIVHRGCW